MCAKPFSKRKLSMKLADFFATTASDRISEGKPAVRAGKHVPATFTPRRRADFPITPVGSLSRGRPSAIAWPSMKARCSARLEGLGQRWQCKPLVHYAQKLSSTRRIIRDRLEKHLGEFSALVEQLDRGMPA